MTTSKDMSRKLAALKDRQLETTLRVVLLALEEIGTPIALSVAILIKNKEWDQVAEGRPGLDPLNYLDSDSFAKDYQADGLLRKADFLPTSWDKRSVALGRFESAEAQCLDTNRRWRSYYIDGSVKPDPLCDTIISKVRTEIHRVLGRFPYERWLDNCRWGPGATTSIRNPRTSVYEKYLEPITGSGPCLTLFLSQVRDVTLWWSFQRGYPCVSDGNKVVFVPKDAKTLRGIAKEPSLDSFCQLGIGQLMRQRFLPHGLNLKTQELNQSLAWYGSLTGKVATIDMKSASDCAALLCVRELFPADWLVAMEACRSTHWHLGGKSGLYHKFSSMGNGYTFEMESLMFFCAARAVQEHLKLPWWEVTSYGDDITIGVEGADLLIKVLNFMGFTVNGSKSFSSGPFRESCGKDFFLGDDVRPYFLRSLLRDVHDLMKCHNGLLRNRVKLPRTARFITRLVGQGEARLYGPRSLGDTVFYSPLPRGNFKLASKRWPMYEGFIVRHYVFKPQGSKFKFIEPGILASLSSVGKGEDSSPTLGISTLRQRGTWVTRAVLVPQWDE